jgi:WD40 repeat protein
VWNAEVNVKDSGSTTCGEISFEANLSTKKKFKRASARDGAGAKLLSGVAGHEDGVAAICPHPNRPSALLSASSAGELRLWDMKDGRVAFRRGLGGGTRVEACVWSPSGERFALVLRNDHRHSQYVVVFDAESGDTVLSTEEMLADEAETHPDSVRFVLAHPMSCCFLDDGVLAIGGDLDRVGVSTGAIRAETWMCLVDVATSAVLHSFPAHKNRIRAVDCKSIAGSDTFACATVSTDGFVKLWEISAVSSTPTHKFIAGDDTGARLTSVCVMGPLALPVTQTASASASSSNAPPALKSAAPPQKQKKRKRGPKKQDDKKKPSPAASKRRTEKKRLKSKRE